MMDLFVVMRTESFTIRIHSYTEYKKLLRSLGLPDIRFQSVMPCPENAYLMALSVSLRL